MEKQKKAETALFEARMKGDKGSIIALLHNSISTNMVKETIIMDHFTMGLKMFVKNNSNDLLGKMWFFGRDKPSWHWPLLKFKSLCFIIEFHKSDFQDLRYGLAMNEMEFGFPDGNTHVPVDDFYSEILSEDEFKFVNQYMHKIRGNRNYSWLVWNHFSIKNWRLAQYQALVNDQQTFVKELVGDVLVQLENAIKECGL